MAFDKAKLKLYSKYNRFARLYAKMLYNGDVDYQRLMNVYNRHEKQPEWKARKLLRKAEIQEVVTDEILKIYDNNGITPDFILKKRLEVLNLALSDEKKDLSNANKVLESFENKLIDIKKEVNTTQTEQISFTKLLDNGQKGKITAKREIKSIENGEKIRIDTSEALENSPNTGSEVPTNDNASDI